MPETIIIQIMSGILHVYSFMHVYCMYICACTHIYI